MKILFVSLGCDKNLVDSEMMLGMLAEQGYSFTDNEEEAEVIVVNTCCFINDAKEESINTLISMGELKKTGQVKALIAAGCLAQRYKEEIITEIPEVDAIIGTTAIDTIVQTIQDLMNGKHLNHIEDMNKKPITEKKRVITTGGHYAYLKIAEGCDKNCTYCIIPKVRGKYRSIPMESLVQEAKDLVEQGVRELILVAQETTLYGVDLYGSKKLPELLKQLCKIEDLVWVRILYCYPEEITSELIQVIKSEEKICHYLDIPIQHGSDPILKKMGRRTNQEQLRNMISTLREEIPDIALRTTLISGFPGETEEDHEELLQFVDEMEFDRLGVFTYSPEEDTPAAIMKEQLEEDLKEQRKNELMELQQAIAFEKEESMIGRKMLAMIEGKLVDENVFMARTYRDAPNVDGYVFVTSETELLTGDFVNVVITDANEYDLIGEIDHEFTK